MDDFDGGAGPLRDRSAEREELAREVEAFLSKGGRVKVVRSPRMSTVNRQSKIWLLHAKGWPIRSIALNVGVSEGAVMQSMRREAARRGVPVPRRQPPTGERDAEWYRRWMDGESYGDIARGSGRTFSAVAKAVQTHARRNGLPMRAKKDSWPGRRRRHGPTGRR